MPCCGTPLNYTSNTCALAWGDALLPAFITSRTGTAFDMAVPAEPWATLVRPINDNRYDLERAITVGRKPWKVALLAVLGAAPVACSGSHPARPVAVAKTQKSATPPATHDSIALYNDTGGTVHVAGCVGCSALGTALAPGQWLPLDMRPKNIQLRIRQPAQTTCLMVVNGVSTGRPLTLRVSDSAATSC